MQAVSPDLLQLTPSAAVANTGLVVLAVLLVLAAVIDVRTLRIPNWLTVGGALAGLAFSTIADAHPLEGFLWSLGGMGAGLAILVPMYAVRAMGAGDVKLMGMVGAFLGLPQILAAVLFVFVAGGLAALGVSLLRGVLGRMLQNIKFILLSMTFSVVGNRRLERIEFGTSVGRLPYGVSISAGTIAFLVARQAGFV